MSNYLLTTVYFELVRNTKDDTHSVVVKNAKYNSISVFHGTPWRDMEGGSNALNIQK